MAGVNVDNLLGDLFGKLDKGESVIKKDAKKKRRQRYVNEEEKFTYRLHEPTLKSVALVLEEHVYVCSCGAKHKAPNLHVLCVKEDKHGNRHETTFMTQSDIDELPRMVRPIEFQVRACADCFHDAKLKPVCDDDAKETLKEVEVDAEITKLLNKWDEEGK